jgi:hypothetical protein
MILAARSLASIPYVRTQIARTHRRPTSLPATDAFQFTGAGLAVLAVAVDDRVLVGAAVVMAAALAWIAHARHDREQIVAVLELPVVIAEWGDERGPAGLGPSSQIADAVASTRDCEVTCIVRLPASTGPDGFVDIVETLSLGDVDAQIFIDSRGRFEPGRSSSSVPVDELRQRQRSVAFSALHQAERAADRLNLWGEEELSDDEAMALKSAERLHASILE